jgi:O-antigen/teichoic acid export membrane protein
MASRTVWSAGGDLTLLVSTLGIFYLLTQELGPGGYGHFVGAQVLVTTLSTFSSGSVGMLIMQEVVREQRPVQEVLRVSLGLSLLAGVVCVAVTVPIGLLLLPGLSITSLVLFAVAQMLARLAAVAALFLTGSTSMLALAVSFCVLGTAGALASLLYVSRRHGLSLRPGLPGRSEARTSLSYACSLLSFSVHEDADKLLLVRLADPVVAGLYAAAYRGVQMATLPLRALVSASHRTFLEPDDGQPRAAVRRSLRVTVPAAAYAGVATVGLIAAAPLVPRLLGPEYGGAQAMFVLLAPLVLLRSLSHLAFNGLMGLGRNGVRLAIVVTSAAVSVVGNLLLIPEYSWRGAVVATLVSEAVFAAATWLSLVVFQRRHDARATFLLGPPQDAPAMVSTREGR